MSNKEEIDALKKRLDSVETWIKGEQQRLAAVCDHHFQLSNGSAVCAKCGQKRVI